MRAFLEKWKGFFTDAVWSISALVLMNGVIQLAVFPFLSRQMGDEQYGNFLYLVSLVNIVAASVGGSVNNIRLKSSVGGQTENGDYNIVLLGSAILNIPFAMAVVRFGGVPMSRGEGILYWILICASIFRIYSDTAFRLELKNLESVRPYVLIATLSQLVYFSSSIFDVILLRFAEEKFQFVTNFVFFAALVCFTLPTTKTWGIAGFTVGYLIATIVRFAVILSLLLRVCKEVDA